MSTIMTRAGAKRWWGIDLPPHVVYLYHDGHSHWSGVKIEWKEYTYAEIFAEKKARQDSRIRSKRVFNRIVPCYIWVFYNDCWFMGGWYIYIECRYGSFSLNFRTGHHEKMIFEKIRRKYHCGVFHELKEFWFEAFARNRLKKKFLI